jgi:hypothetical protein
LQQKSDQSIEKLEQLDERITNLGQYFEEEKASILDQIKVRGEELAMMLYKFKVLPMLTYITVTIFYHVLLHLHCVCLIFSIPVSIPPHKPSRSFLSIFLILLCHSFIHGSHSLILSHSFILCHSCRRSLIVTGSSGWAETRRW